MSGMSWLGQRTNVKSTPEFFQNASCTSLVSFCHIRSILALFCFGFLFFLPITMILSISLSKNPDLHSRDIVPVG